MGIILRFIGLLVSFWIKLQNFWIKHPPSKLHPKPSDISRVLSIKDRVNLVRSKVGDLYYQRDGSEPIVVIGSLELAQAYYQHFSQSQRIYPYLGYVFDQLLKDCLGVSFGPEWTTMKKPLIQYFHNNSLYRMTPRICQLVSAWMDHNIHEGMVKPLSELNFERLTMTILGEIVYGQLEEDDLTELIRLFEQHNLLMRAMGTDYILRYPWLHSFSPNKNRVDKFKQDWTQFNQKHRSVLGDSEASRTLYQSMLESEVYQDQAKCDSTLYEVVLFNLDIMIDTFAAWIWNLSKFPLIQKTLYQEIEGILPEDAVHLPYLSACLNESARLYPGIALTFPEILEQPIQLNGILIPARTQISLDTQMINRDPNIWTEPDRFNPDRFIDQPSLVNSFHRFGLGPRKCLGNNYADRILKVLTLTLLQKYQVMSVESEPTLERRATLPNLSNTVMTNSVKFTLR